MSEYFRHARARGSGARPGRVAWSRPPEPVARPGRSPSISSLAPDGVRVRAIRRARPSQPAVWLEAFEVAIDNGEPVSDEVLRCVQENVGRYTADYFMATRGRAPRLRAMLAPDAGPVGAAVGHARLRAARRDLPGVREDPLPRDSRLLPQVHRRRAHAADDPRTSSRCGIRRARAARGSARSSTRSTRRSS